MVLAEFDNRIQDRFYYNVPSDLMFYFSCPGRPVSLDEWNRFWSSLSSAEKNYYRHYNLFGSKR
jgi:hypothetical protein